MMNLNLNLRRRRTTQAAARRAEDEILADLKEQARVALQQPVTTAALTAASTDPGSWAPPVPAAPVPTASAPATRTPRFLDAIGFGPPPQPTYEPPLSKAKPVSTNPPFGSVPSGEFRGTLSAEQYGLPQWEKDWARLTPSERAWSSAGAS